MDEIKKFEYEKAYESMRFFLEYRLKVFGFFAVANGLLVAAVFTHAKDSTEKIALATFGAIIGIIIYLIDVRIMNLARRYRDVAIETASDINAKNLLGVHKGIADSGVKSRCLVQSSRNACGFSMLISIFVFIKT